MFELLPRDGRNPGNLVYRRLTQTTFNARYNRSVFIVEGSINQAHQPNEHVELKQVSRAIDIIRILVQFHCL